MGRHGSVALNILLLLLLKTMASNYLEPLVGVVNKRPLRIPPNTEHTLHVFGKDLPDSGYFFTSGPSCNSRNASERSIAIEEFDVKNGFYRKSEHSIILKLKEGLPFTDKDPSFRLCNAEAVPINEELLIVYSSLPPVNYVILPCVAICVVLSAIGSGLNIAFMQLSISEVTLISENGAEPHKTYAKNMLWYRKKSNWLICTFATANTMVNNGIALLLDEFFKSFTVSNVFSIIVPATIIVLFGELLPTSICNRRGMCIASKTRYFTFLLFVVFSPIAWPLSKIIDIVLGREAREVCTEEKMNALIKHQANKVKELTRKGILAATADFPKKRVADVMTPIDDAFILSCDDILTQKLMITIVEKGYTRIPVHRGKNRLDIFGILNTKDLAVMDYSNEQYVKELVIQQAQQMRYVSNNMRVSELIREMNESGCHLYVAYDFVFSKRNQVCGIITFEDAIEELFGEIEDESDKVWANRRSGRHRDQATLDWFREEDAELTVNQQLFLIEHMLSTNKPLVHLGFNVLLMRNLTAKEKRHVLPAGDVHKSTEDSMIIIYSGAFMIVSCGDTRHSDVMRVSIEEKDHSPPYIIGKHVVNKLYAEFLSPSEPNTPRFESISIRAMSEVKYIQITRHDLIFLMQDTNDHVASKKDLIVDDELIGFTWHMPQTAVMDTFNDSTSEEAAASPRVYVGKHPIPTPSNSQELAPTPLTEKSDPNKEGDLLLDKTQNDSIKS